MVFPQRSWIRDIAVDADGNALFAGSTIAAIPTTPGVVWPDFDPTPFGRWGMPRSQAFAAKLNASGTRLLFATYLRSQEAADESAETIAVDEQGFVYAGGTALWKLNPNATQLVFSTAFRSIGKARLGLDGMLYVAGQGTNFGTAPDAYAGQTLFLWPAFIARLTPSGKVLASTVLGGGRANSIEFGADGSVVVAGSTTSLRFPTHGLLETPIMGGQMGFVARLNGSLSELSFGSYLGGGVAGAVPDGDGAIVSVLAGRRGDEPGVVLVRTVERQRGLAPRIDAVLNEASLLGGPIATGERVLIRGAGFAPAARVWFGDVEAELLAASESELIVQAPELPEAGSLALKVETPAGRSQPLEAEATRYSLTLYTLHGTGYGEALVLHEDGSVNSQNNPAPRGSVVTFLVNGVGPLRAEGGSVVPPEPLEVYVAGAYAQGVDAQLLPVAGLAGRVLRLKVYVPEPPPNAVTELPAEVGVNVKIGNQYSAYQQWPLTMWIQ